VLTSRVLPLLLMFTLAAPAIAFADWMVTPFIGLKFAGRTNIVDLEQGASNTKMTLGVSVGMLSDGIFGIEGELGHSPRFFERSGGGALVARSNVTTLTGSVLVAVPRRITQDSLRPYAVAGIGLVHVAIDDAANVLPVDGNILGMSLGGGAIGQLTNRASIRFEVRHIRNIAPASKENVPGLGVTEISFWRATVGIALMGNLF
jgi:opacity protein-like surface antigen